MTEGQKALSVTVRPEDLILIRTFCEWKSGLEIKGRFIEVQSVR